ncbi:nitrate- and nitrite sensing domain-containing protein [Actinokineospora cianjurensis]|uniref:histidine kinase n=1 Tax=Actinokineospora cianjurensis TaxID=585224 RepID=A0A421BD45_9PSEU|nr:nitrate- and nitrite sensing domain-containing protein [Actinokineospora cianjurensis]RLK62302.1 signal transduction histidine kinase [Actinokineospora cianjurensis]
MSRVTGSGRAASVAAGRIPGATTARRAAPGTAGGEAGRSPVATLTRWRDWNIPVKLAAVIMVPVAFAIVLGVLRISGQVERAESYQRVDKLVAVNDSLRKALTWLQRERTKAAVLLTGGSRDIAAELAGERQSADYAREEMFRAIGKATFDTEVTKARLVDVTSAFDTLTALRRPVGAGAVDSGTALAGYTDVIHTLLDFDRATTGEVADPGLANTAAALHDLEAAKEEVYYQQGLVAIGIARGGLNAADLDSLRASQSRLAERTADFRSIATLRQQSGYDALHDAPEVRTRTELLRLAVGDGSDGSASVNVPLPITSVDWNSSSEQVSERITAVSALLGAEIKDRSSAMQDEASDAAGLASVVLILALVAAAAVMIVIGRQLLGSLALLRRGALDVATRRLPAAVARIRDGDDVVAPVVEPVAVLPDDEVGQVARAFDAVHEQALRLATEQAVLRANYSNVFVNLSRRSQGLVQRQLHLLERLERDEEDADQLATLFQLDHLATRMRRNNENLMVLSGSDPARRAQAPTQLGDLLRAAVSEVEHYERVVIAPPPAVLVVGYAVGDLVRLTAELLDNATAFSAPATQVLITSQVTDTGAIRVEVVDRGIGLSEQELADANTRLADSRTVDASTSRRMGLFVVGRLAARLNVEVRLLPGAQTGVRAVIAVPADLVAGDVGLDLPRVVAARESHGTNGSQSAHGSNGHTGSNGHGAVNGNGSANGNGSTNGRGAGSRNGSNGHGSNGHGSNGHNGTDHGESNGTGPSGFTAGLARRLANGKPRWEPTGAPGGDGAEQPGSLPIPSPTPSGDGVPLPRRSPRAPVQPDVPPVEQTQALFVPDDDPVEHVERAEQPGPAQSAFDGGVRHDGGVRDGGDFDGDVDDDSGWWDTTLVHQAAVVPPAAALHETTPIFDEMVSAWFRAVTDDPNSTAADVTRGPDWDFAADQGFHTARAVSAAEPEDFTTSGLPRRTPRRNLVPGGVQQPGRRAAAAAPPAHARDPQDLRERLSSYQRGIHRARGAHRAGPAHGEPETDAQPGLDLRGARWRFARDAGWQAAEALTTHDDADPLPDGGLPRRTPRERLVPGSLGADTPAQQPAVLIERDAEALRSRLGSLQRGIGRGRSSIAQRHPGQDGDTEEEGGDA